MIKYLHKKGFLLVGILVFAAVALLIISAVIGAAVSNIKLSREIYDRERAFHVAEAGNEYYRWHLAHAQTDYYDGKGATSTAPYIHAFSDKDGVLMGTFSLTLTPSATGTNIIKIKSKGSVLTSSTTRSVVSTLAIPSLAKYAVVSNDNLRFGAGTEVFGPIHSNGGIRFDGLAHNLITSALSSYDDPDQTGGNQFGVYTHVIPPPGSGTYSDTFVPAEASPNSPTNRSDVFMTGRQFPVPAFDFAGMTTDLAGLKTQAQSSSGKYFAASGAQGYHIIFKNNDTYDVYKVTSLITPAGACDNAANQTDWGSWSIKTETFVANYAIPANGVIFVEDNVWTEGQINTARVTLASAKFPYSATTATSITINNNLLYTKFDGSDVISLIAQENVNVGEISQDTLTIDAALVAQTGRIGRYYYDPYDCSPYGIRSTLNLYGMIASDVRYGFAYTDNTGYQTRNLTYDGNLLYGPPPSFPLTSNQYSTIGWEDTR